MNATMECMLTTTDNPFNPFKDWASWERFDKDHGYNTMSYINRVIITSPDLSPADQEEAFAMAVDEILELNITGNYKKIFEESEDA